MLSDKCRFRKLRVCSQFVALIMVILFNAGCTRDHLPKPLGYNRLKLPDPAYQPLPDSLPYSFEYSRHARLLPDTSAVRERFWVEIYYPVMKANIHVTYKGIDNNKKLLREFLDDAYTLTAASSRAANNSPSSLLLMRSACLRHVLALRRPALKRDHTS